MLTKTKNRLWSAVLMLSLLSTGGWAQVGSLTKTGDLTVCLNSTTAFGVVETPGSTYAWSLIPGTGGGGTLLEGTAPNNLISVNWLTAGTCTLQVIETSATCTGQPVTIQVTVLPVIVPGVASADQIICFNTIPELITATEPNGGSGTYEYQWEFSTDGGSSWEPVANANSLTYQPGPLTETTAYRLQQDSEGSCGAVTTNSIQIMVQPEIITSPIWH